MAKLGLFPPMNRCRIDQLDSCGSIRFTFETVTCQEISSYAFSSRESFLRSKKVSALVISSSRMLSQEYYVLFSAFLLMFQ